MAITGAGLEGVVATTSSICFIDGEAGILSYNGYNIHTLADNATFEEVIFLLWNGKLPNQAELANLKAELVADRENSCRSRSVPEERARRVPPMDVLRTAVSMLGLYDPLVRETSDEANVKKAAKLMAQSSHAGDQFLASA